MAKTGFLVALGIVLALLGSDGQLHVQEEIDDPGAYMFTPSPLNRESRTKRTTTTPTPETTTAITEFTGTTDKDDKKNPDPSFVDEIENVTAPAGRTVKLQCTVKDLGSYRVAWMHFEQSAILTVHTNVITRNPRISVTHDNLRTWILSIKDVQEEDHGRYMCQINTANAKTQIGYLKVVVPPSIDDSQSSSDAIVREGANVTLSCLATGSPEPTVKWKRDDSLDININKTLKVPEWEGQTLELTRISRLDMGAYLCIASNGVPPTVSKRIKVSVDFPPMLQIPHQLVGAPLGSVVVLECYTEAHPVSLNYWTRDSVNMITESEKFHTTMSPGSVSYKTYMTLTIRNVTTDDYGTYRCVAKNPRGETDGAIRLYNSIGLWEPRNETHTITDANARDKGSKYQSSLNDINKSEQKSALDAGGKGPRQDWPPDADSGCDPQSARPSTLVHAVFAWIFIVLHAAH